MGWPAAAGPRRRRTLNEPGHHHTDSAERDTRPAALIGLIVILVLAILGILLARALRTESQREDCLMSGRSNCAPIELPIRK